MKGPEIKKPNDGLKKTTHEINLAINKMAKNTNRIHITGLDGQESIAVGWNKQVEIHIDGNSGPYIGAFNQKAIITLHGNAGDLAGDTLNGGGLVIIGNCGDRCGTKMRSGIIVIKGNSGNGLGYSMYDGTILLDGNVKGDVGSRSKGGLIIITGDVEGNIGPVDDKICIMIGGKHQAPESAEKIMMDQKDLLKLNKYFNHYAIKADSGVFSKYVIKCKKTGGK